MRRVDEHVDEEGEDVGEETLDIQNAVELASSEEFVVHRDLLRTVADRSMACGIADGFGGCGDFCGGGQ